MKLRSYRTADCAEMAQLFYDTVHTVNAADYGPEQLAVWATGEIEEAVWDRSFLGSHTLVAEEDGVIVGFGNMDDSGYLDKLYVHKEYQRRGIASAICGALEKGCDAPRLTTHASITARPFFEKRGYRVVRQQQVERGGVLLTNFVMEKPHMQRIMVIGCPGSGKSTFSRALQEALNLPLCYLDMLFWNADKTTVTREKFDSRLGEILFRESWIIDGNYNRTLEMRLERCDTVFFLDYPPDVCLAGAMSRIGRKRPDMPWVEEEADPEFLDYIRNFARDQRPTILHLLEQYSDKKILVFHTREESDEYLRRCIRG